MLTPGFCWWYLAKAAAKKGATKVEPAPVRVPAWLIVPKVAGVGAGPVGVVAPLEAHAATAMTAAHAAPMVGCAAVRLRAEPPVVP
jgi:hypothetical protein